MNVVMTPSCHHTGVCWCFPFPHPPPMKKTVSKENLKFWCICAGDYPSLAPECHLWHRFYWEGAGGDMGGAIAWKK
eukprot:7734222-Ditylum_brightwellii.AAC.1